MTMIIAANLGEYILLATDKRKVMIGSDGLILDVISDNEEKISFNDNLAITGMGYTEILDEFKSLLLKTKIENTDTFLSLAKQIYDSRPISSEYKFSTTKYVITYKTQLNDDVLLNIGIIEASKPNQLIKIDNVIVLGRNTEDVNSILINILKEKLKIPDKDTINDPHLLNENIMYNQYVFLAMFELISKPDNSVSPNADFIVITKKHKPYFMGN